MNYTDQQFEALAQFEGHFEKALRASWCPYPGPAGVELIRKAVSAATKRERRVNASCNNCILNLVKDAARMWYADKQARIDAANDAKAVELTKQAAAKPAPKKKSTKKSTKK